MILTVKKTYEVLCEVGLVSQRSHWSHSIWQSPWTVQKRREISGDLASCAYLLLRLTKHSQQVLRCSWLHFLELNNIQLSFLLKASGDKHSHSSIWRHLFRLIIHSSMDFLSTTHTATQILAIFLQVLPMVGTTEDQRQADFEENKYSSINVLF